MFDEDYLDICGSLVCYLSVDSMLPESQRPTQTKRELSVKLLEANLHMCTPSCPRKAFCTFQTSDHNIVKFITGNPLLWPPYLIFINRVQFVCFDCNVWDFSPDLNWFGDTHGYCGNSEHCFKCNSRIARYVATGTSKQTYVVLINRLLKTDHSWRVEVCSSSRCDLVTFISVIF